MNISINYSQLWMVVKDNGYSGQINAFVAEK